MIDRNPIGQLKRLKEDRLGLAPYLSTEQEDALRQALANRDRLRASARRRANKWRADRGLSLYPEIPVGGFSDYLSPLVLLAINTGLRRAELFNLSWDHVNPDFKTITVLASIAKSRSTRYVALNSEAEAILRGWHGQAQDNPLVFPSAKTGGPLTDIKRAWKAVRESAGISGFRFHDLRHHFASRLVMEGVPLNTVRDLLGHSDLNMTLRYAHLAPSHRAEAVARLVRSQN